jgi:hypothetical protein
MFIPVMRRLIALENRKEPQSGPIDHLESKLQVFADEFQHQRDDEEALRRNHSAQMELQMKQFTERMEVFQKKANERVQAVENACDMKVKNMEKTMLATIEAFEGICEFKMMTMEKNMLAKIEAVEKNGASKIKKLKEVIRAQDERIEMLNGIFPAVFEQHNELVEKVDGLEKSVATRGLKAKPMTEPTERRRTGVRQA